MNRGNQILFTTAYLRGKPFDIWRSNTRDNLPISLTTPRFMQPGLRFIKQNLPQIEILEFPSWEEFTQVINRGWDVVGFSFYTCEVNEILRMADYARKTGVRELWAGNYGALDPSIKSTFDKVFVGYSEDNLAQELGCEIGELIHPPLINSVGIKPFGSPFLRYGELYTSRGCPLKCDFCQTPVFANKVVKIPIDSIERVLRYYKQNGVQIIFIYDEIFGIGSRHVREVVSLLGKYKIPWWVMTRGDILKRNFDEWYENGLFGANIGIESMGPGTLEDIHTRERIESALEALELLNRHNCCAIGAYFIGFEQETVDSVKCDFQQIRQSKPDFMNLFILTPGPQTPLWAQIQQDYEAEGVGNASHAIDTSDWSKFNGKHLVWNHPQLTSDDAQALLEYGYDLFNSQEYVLKIVNKITHSLLDKKGPLGTHQFFLSSLHNRLHGGVGGFDFFD